MINARSETVAAKPSFRNAFKWRRCLILADGFFDWKEEKGQKQPMFLIQPITLEIAIEVACKIGRAARRGRRIGTIFVISDALRVFEGGKQLVPNPFHGHEKSNRMLTNPDIHDALVELSKLDGAFVLRGDGFIQAAGFFLGFPPTEIQLIPGLGARHASAAAVTMRTRATAIVVSATDGNTRAFSGGKMVLKIDPDVSHGHISMNE